MDTRNELVKTAMHLLRNGFSEGAVVANLQSMFPYRTDQHELVLEAIRHNQRNRRNQRNRSSRQARNEAMDACGLKRGKDSLGRTIWE